MIGVAEQEGGVRLDRRWCLGSSSWTGASATEGTAAGCVKCRFARLEGLSIVG